jgi:flagellar motor switch protein FliM
MFHKPFFKELALFLAEQISNYLKFQVTVVGIEMVKSDYRTMAAQFPEQAFLGLMNRDNHGFLIQCGSQWVMKATDRLLGGTGDGGATESSSSDYLTFSEQFFFKIFLEWHAAFFTQKELPLTLLRTERYSRNINLFFPDEKMIGITFQFKINTTFGTAFNYYFPQALLEKKKVKQMETADE